MGEPIYSDGRYRVTAGSVSTPSRFYPVANTTAAVRRDPLWAGLAFAALSGSTLLVYGDLLLGGEKLVFVVATAVSLFLGSEVRLLRLHAIGHPPATIVGRRRRIAALYRAIRSAHDGLNGSGLKQTPSKIVCSSNNSLTPL